MDNPPPAKKFNAQNASHVAGLAALCAPLTAEDKRREAELEEITRGLLATAAALEAWEAKTEEERAHILEALEAKEERARLAAAAPRRSWFARLFGV